MQYGHVSNVPQKLFSEVAANVSQSASVHARGSTLSEVVDIENAVSGSFQNVALFLLNPNFLRIEKVNCGKWLLNHVYRMDAEDSNVSKYAIKRKDIMHIILKLSFVVN